MIRILKRLTLFEKPWEYACFFLLIVATAAVLNETREIVFSGSDKLPTHQNMLRAAFTAVPLAACGTAILAYASGLRRELEVLARTDQLTGLPNRRHFFEGVEEAITSGQRGVLLMADVDRFKMVNDTHGHPVGDQCLQEFAKVIQSNLRATDQVARLGGEEFALFLPDATMTDARGIAQRLVEGVELALEGDVDPDGAKTKVTMSVGLAQTDGYSGFADLIRQSDLALYAAKEQGRARALVFGQHAPEAVPVETADWPRVIASRSIAS